MIRCRTSCVSHAGLQRIESCLDKQDETNEPHHKDSRQETWQHLSKIPRHIIRANRPKVRGSDTFGPFAFERSGLILGPINLDIVRNLGPSRQAEVFFARSFLNNFRRQIFYFTLGAGGVTAGPFEVSHDICRQKEPGAALPLLCFRESIQSDESSGERTPDL